MRFLTFIAIFMYSTTIFGADANVTLPSQTIEKLRDAGFEFAFPTDAEKRADVKSELKTSAVKRFLDVFSPDLLPLAEAIKNLEAHFATANHSDVFEIKAAIGSDKIQALISEFQIDVVVLPTAPSRQNIQTAQAAFQHWSNILFQQMWQVPGTNQVVEILDGGEYFFLYKTICDEHGNKRSLRWTRSESIKMALDKKGCWLIISVRDDLPVKATSLIAGERFRSRGSWFTSQSSKTPRSKKSGAHF